MPRLVALLCLLIASGAHASSTLRCGSNLVSTGASSAEVQSKCGQPISQEKLGYKEVPVYGYGGGYTEVLVEEWIYGPRGGMYDYLRFEGNRLSNIESRRGR
ncbi:DUF2845 domain-containing protein [Pseudomonas sp. LRF_L74]|uniref:DUF2845 domain-containing protein n=1 Tax=Pseudomonas sp. LRF_L74 TaxID=3369422 RepID=UPI003F6123E9